MAIFGVLTGFVPGVWKSIVIAGVILLGVAAIIVDILQTRQNDAETKALEAQKRNMEDVYERSIIQYLDDLVVVAMHTCNGLTNTQNKRRNKSSNIASARQAALSSLKTLIGEANSKVRANLFVPDPDNPEVFCLAEGGFTGRGEKSYTKFTKEDLTYQQALLGNGTFSNAESVREESGGRYSAYATSPVIGNSQKKEEGQRLYAILTVDTPERDELSKERDGVLLQLISHLLAITFVSAGNEPSVSLSVDTSQTTDSG
ncbi:hypothetical protein [Corynebacterium macclintockiae]|uniref:hypothetical protein n=1 Tax=Corynebacterium macclintockiae TaxID=2913501 RepID=UPI003EB79B18